MTGSIPFSYKGKTGEKNVIEDVEDDVYEITDSDFSKATAIIFDKIYIGRDGFLPSSNFVDLIVTLGEGFHSKYLAGHM